MIVWYEGGGGSAVGSDESGWVIYVLIKISNMRLYMSVNVSFICRPVLVMSYIWNISIVLGLGPFFSMVGPIDRDNLEIETISVDGAQLSSFHLKTETESIFQNVVCSK
jgi:hypothetical protein